MISEKKRLQIANICYANVAGSFADFMNPDNRGPNFTWGWFIMYSEELATTWMRIHNVRGHRETINETAKQYAREIAENLVDRTGVPRYKHNLIGLT
jgi:hypothetical protein